MSVSAPASEFAIEAEGRPILDATLAPPDDHRAARAKKLGLGILAPLRVGRRAGERHHLRRRRSVALLPDGRLRALGHGSGVRHRTDPAGGRLFRSGGGVALRQQPLQVRPAPPVHAGGHPADRDRVRGAVLGAEGPDRCPQFLYVLVALFTARIAISVFQVPYFALGGSCLTTTPSARRSWPAG